MKKYYLVFFLFLCLKVNAQIYNPYANMFNFQPMQFDLNAISQQAFEQSRLIQEAGNNKIVLSCINNTNVEYAYLQLIYLDGLMNQKKESYVLLSIKFKDLGLYKYRLFNNATLSDLSDNPSAFFSGTSRSYNIKMTSCDDSKEPEIKVHVLGYDDSDERVLYNNSDYSDNYIFKLSTVLEGTNNYNGGYNGSSGRNRNSIEYDLNKARNLLQDLRRQKESSNSGVLEQQYNRMIIEQENRIRELTNEYNMSH